MSDSTGDLIDSFPAGRSAEAGGELSRSDLRMIRAAIKNEYPINEAVRKLIVSKLSLIVGRSPDERQQVAAARVLVAADAVNVKREQLQQADIHKQLPDKHLHVHAETQAKIVITLPDNGRQ